MTEKEIGAQAKKSLGRCKIVLLCLAVFLAVIGTVFMFMDADLLSVDVLGGEFYLRHPETGVMPLVGTVLLFAALVITFFEEKHPKLFIASLVLPMAAAGVIFPSFLVTNLKNAPNALPLVGYWLAVSAGILGLVACVISAVLLFKNRKSFFASAKQDPSYVLRLTEAAEALTAIRDLYERGILTDKEYEEEKAFVMHLYGIGKLARDGATEGFLERKAIPEEEIIETEETITIISNGFDDDFDD